MTAVAKPQLRGLLLSRMRLHVPLALVTALGAGLLMKVFYRDARRERVNEFYRNYDVEKEAARLREMGVFKRTGKD